jgi:hypothetical protein
MLLAAQLSPSQRRTSVELPDPATSQASDRPFIQNVSMVWEVPDGTVAHV